MQDRTGQQIGNYRLVRLIGQGASSEVWLAEQLPTKKPVAIKLIKTTQDHTSLEAFIIETRTVLLQHPHIIKILDFGVHKGTPYLVMPYAAAGSVRARHPSGQPVPLDTVVGYVRQASQALAHAHAAGIIHRDIKPENLLLDDNGDLLLTDFGVAVQLQLDKTHTGRSIAGTPLYIAPEQFNEEPHVASDQYSLAVVVYEWLAGEKPFTGNYPQLVLKHTSEPPPPLRARVPSLPAAVEQVVLRGLAKAPRARYPSIEAFAAALEQAASGIVSQPDVIARLQSLQQAEEALQDEAFQQALIELIARDEQWWRGAVLPALQKVQSEARQTPGSTLPASFAALVARARPTLSEALLAPDEARATGLLGLLSLLAPPANAPQVWRELLSGLTAIQPMTVPWALRSWLIQQWARLTPPPEAALMRPWLACSWQEVEQAIKLKLPVGWHQLCIEALLAQSFIAESLEIIERQKALFQTTLSAMLEDDQQWGQARGFFARLVQQSYRLKLELLGSLLAAPTLDAQKAESIWRAAALSLEERETFFKRYRPFLPLHLAPVVRALLDVEQRKLMPGTIAGTAPAGSLSTQPEAVHVSLDQPTPTVVTGPARHRREWLLEGNIHYEAGRYHEALACYEEAIRLDPTYANSYQSKGNALRALGRPREALPAYERAIQLKPKEAMFYTGKGWALVDLREFEHALRAFDEALARDPHLLFALLGRGTASNELTHNDESLAAFTRVLELAPQLAVAHRGKGKALLGLGRGAEAEQAFQRARELGDTW